MLCRPLHNVRHGTSTLFAALEISTGKVTAALNPRHRHQEFLAFLKQVTRSGQEGDQLTTHKEVAQQMSRTETFFGSYANRDANSRAGNDDQGEIVNAHTVISRGR